MTDDKKKKGAEQIFDDEADRSRSSSVFDAPSKKDMFDVPPTGGVFDAPAKDESASPFDGDVEPFKADDKDIDQAVDEVFTSVKPGAIESDKGTSKKSGVKKRSETSILFSLGNLNSLANEPEQPEDEAISVQTTALESEMSGLIDIRMLSEAFAKKEDTGLQDIMSVDGDAFSPVLTFQARGMSRNAKLAIVGVAAALVVALLIAFAYALSGDKKDDSVDEQIALIQKQIEQLRKHGSGDSSQVAALEAKLAKAQDAEKMSGSSGEDISDNQEDQDSKSFDRKKHGRSKNYKLKSKDAVSNPSSDTSDTEKPSKKKGSSDLDDLLSSSLSKPSSRKKKSSSSATGGNVKAALSRSDVQRGMGSVAGPVKACGGGQGGLVTMKVIIGSNGRVISAKPTGAHSGTKTGSCAAKAVKKAKFPQCKKSTTVSYPFRL